MAIDAATHADLVVEIIGVVRTGAAASAIADQVGLADWLPLYRDPRRLRKSIIQYAEREWPGKGHTLLTKFFAARTGQDRLAAIEVLDHAPPAAIQEAKEKLGKLFRGLYGETFRSIDYYEEPAPLEDPAFDAALATPEMQFFTLVMLPCMLEYGETATRLYARARRGDDHALKELLHIDKSIMRDPALGKRLQHKGMTRPEFVAEAIGNAWAATPDVDQDRQKIKQRLAAYIVQQSKALAFKLQPVEVRHLYDAIAKDRTGNAKALDPDLPDEYDDPLWRQHVRRAKPFWRNTLKRDKTQLAVRNASWLHCGVVSEQDDTATVPDWFREQAAVLDQPRRAAGWCGALRRVVAGVFRWSTP